LNLKPTPSRRIGQRPSHGRLRRLSLTFTHFAAYWLAFSLLAVGHWVARKYGEPTFEQLLYHLQFGADGLAQTDPTLIRSFVRNCIAAPMLLAAIAYVFEKLTVTAHDMGWRFTIRAALTALKRGLRTALRLWMATWYRLFKWRLPVLLVLVGAAYFMTKISLWSHLGQLMGQDIMSRYYVAPEAITAPTGPKRNLVLVYAESLEDAYGKPAVFGEDLLKSLRSKRSVSFGRLQPTPGTGWTIAGIVASQCGIPLRPVIHDPNDMGASGEFLPSITCLGDILKAHGYVNVFMGGASLSFAGKGLFLRSHGYEETWGTPISSSWVITRPWSTSTPMCSKGCQIARFITSGTCNRTWLPTGERFTTSMRSQPCCTAWAFASQPIDWLWEVRALARSPPGQITMTPTCFWTSS
jgi:phosphoglycerol transferase